MQSLTFRCADINSEFCPCLLAETNHCVFCSKLQGKPLCECEWPGVCVYYEKYWRDKEASRRAEAAGRATEKAAITRKEQVGERTYLFEFAVSEGLAHRLAPLGSFVFLRCENDPDCAHFPVGVMRAKDGKVLVAVEAVGAKSSRLILSGDGHAMLRGPYFNGVLGKPWIENLSGGSAVVIAGGIGQAPALPIIEALLAGGNRVRAILAPGKVGSVFVREMLNGAAVELHAVDSLRKDGFTLLKQYLQEEPDLLVSAGPDAQHAGVIRFMNAHGRDLPMAATNNATMCCGEGICGSCHKLTQDNKTVKLCKAQIDFQQILQE